MSLRYHLVSLAAVLMALAAGVVLGAGPLANAVDTVVQPKPSASTQAGSAASAAALAQLQAVARYDDAVTAVVGARTLHGTLSGQRVVLVVGAGAATQTVAATVALLQRAGATVTGQVMLTALWSDPHQSTVLSGITDQLAPPDTKPGDGTPAGSAAAALAAAVLTTKPADLGKASDASTALLAGLEQGGFLTVKGTPAQAASLSVLVAATGAGGGAQFLPLAQALAAAGSGTVAAAPRAAGPGQGLAAAVRADSAARAAVSTVDCVDLAAGRVALVLALGRELTGHHGQYGLGAGADAPLPGG